MSHTVRFVAVSMLALGACSASSTSSGGPSDPLSADPAGEACAAHATLDVCLADTANRCYWGPNYAWPVQVDGEPCQPLEGMCQSELSTPFRPECTVDATNEAACSAWPTWDACVVDTEHRCSWTPEMGVPCTPDGWCPPPAHCGAAPDCAPHCASSGPTISTPVYADCGCLTPPGGVCIQPAGAPSVTSCVERPACDGADVCACLTGLGTCTPGELPNVCVCTGA